MEDKAPPAEKDMFRKVDQLRTESHINVCEANLADALYGSSRAREATPRSVLGDLSITRSQLGTQASSKPPKPGSQRKQHSQNRVEPTNSKEISGWFEEHKDKLKKGDEFFAKPVPNMGNSCVKYDIISNERRQFWY
jgi:hypothetical protein